MKLNKNEAYDLLKKFLNHWAIREHAFEEIEEYIDDYLRDCGYEIYTRALSWEKGTSYDDRKAFSKTLYDYDCNWVQENHLEDDFPDFETVHHRILELTKDVLAGYMDIEIKPMAASIKKRTIEKEQEYWECPSCGKENTNTYHTPTGNKCRHCKVLVELK